MTEFKREPRYIVLKVKDIEAYLPKGSMDVLCTLGNAIHEGRMADGKAPFNAVVVEQDWPEFEPTWEAIEARMTGQPIEPLTAIKIRLRRLESQARHWRMVLDAAEERLSQDGCDCGDASDIPCELCQIQNALKNPLEHYA